jgi:hypothetical protein
MEAGGFFVKDARLGDARPRWAALRTGWNADFRLNGDFYDFYDE